MTSRDAAQALRAARDYYDQTTVLYLQHLGETFQAGIARSPGRDGTAQAYRRHNLFLAGRAGIVDGECVLDAGCGVCGPAVDLAERFTSVSIVGVTVSGVQAKVARRRIQARGLGARVRVLTADFHRLPFSAKRFDLATFNESAGYSPDQSRLFAEMARVLAPGGRLYVKDIFRRDGEMSVEQRRQLAVFDATFAYATRSVGETVAAIRSAGFSGLRATDLSDQLETRMFQRAMFERVGAEPRLNDFGKRHFKAFDRLPVFFADILAIR